MYIRSVRSDDLEGLRAFAEAATAGLTTLPRDSALLSEKIEASRHACAQEVSEPATEQYLFVMVDSATEKLAGVCGILARVGMPLPLYVYERKVERHSSALLGFDVESPYLELSAIHKGPSEVRTLYLSPDYRSGGYGRLLSLSRFLFVASHPERFDSTMSAEMRGYSDDKGLSPFYETVARHFFREDFDRLNKLRARGEHFIADLIPKHPFYVEVLPESAQEVIGKAHDNTVPALKLLESEGFAFDGRVDIFDAGPHVFVETRNIRSIKESREVFVGAITNTKVEGVPQIISNTRMDFRACYGAVTDLEEDTATISASVAKLLNVKEGDRIRFVATRAGEGS